MPWLELPIEETAEHFLLFLGILGAITALITWLRGEKKRRKALLDAAYEAKQQQEEQTKLLKRIDRELHPKNGDNGGPTAVDRIEGGVRRNADGIAANAESIRSLREHVTEMDERNSDAHDQLHRRIDGFYEAIGINNVAKQRIFDRHHLGREADDETQ